MGKLGKGHLGRGYIKECSNCKDGCVACGSDFKDLYLQYEKRAGKLEELLKLLYNKTDRSAWDQEILLEVIQAIDWE